MAGLTTHRIAAAVRRGLFARSFTLNNYTPGGWWECDVFELTKAGWFREYEIKASRADFLKDCRKKDELHGFWGKYPTGSGRRSGLTKHALLSQGHEQGPSHYFFVTASGIVTLEDIPEWAGWLEATSDGRFTNIRKRAPQLHKTKLAADIEKHARATCYWRMHRLLDAGHAANPDFDWELGGDYHDGGGI